MVRAVIHFQSDEKRWIPFLLFLPRTRLILASRQSFFSKSHHFKCSIRGQIRLKLIATIIIEQKKADNARSPTRIHCINKSIYKHFIEGTQPHSMPMLPGEFNTSSPLNKHSRYLLEKYHYDATADENPFISTAGNDLFVLLREPYWHESLRFHENQWKAAHAKLLNLPKKPSRRLYLFSLPWQTMSSHFFSADESST